MKVLILFAVALTLLTLATHAKAAIGTSMKIEGSCSGTLVDGSAVSFVYYSNYNGCKKVNKAALTFTAGIEGLLTGTRSFRGNKDVYAFPEHKLTFDDSTGNTSGTLRYQDTNGLSQKIPVSCEVRDYEYVDC